MEQDNKEGHELLREEIDNEILERLHELAKKHEIETVNKIVDNVLDEVLAIDGKIRLNRLLVHPKERSIYRDNIKRLLNKHHEYNLPLNEDKKWNTLINDIKNAIDE
mgnify:CR=1 FL=1